MEKEHCALKATLLIRQMHAQFDEFARGGRYKTSEEKECKHKTRFLLEFTKGNANDHLNETIEGIEKEHESVRNKKTIELIIREFLSKFLLLDNRHTTLLHAINYLKRHPQIPRDMLSKLQYFNNRVLKYYITSSCNNVEKRHNESDLLVFLLNTCNDDSLFKFMSKHKDMDPDIYLVKTTAQTCTRIEEHGKK